MRTRPAFRRFQLMRGAPPDSRRQGILAARGSSNSPHQKLCYAAGLDSHGLMKPDQPHASRIDPSFGRDRLAPLSLQAILQLFPSLFKLPVLPQPALFNPELCGGSAPHEFLIRSARLRDRALLLPEDSSCRAEPAAHGSGWALWPPRRRRRTGWRWFVIEALISSRSLRSLVAALWPLVWSALASIHA
jgi:hypothetical protein